MFLLIAASAIIPQSINLLIVYSDGHSNADICPPFTSIRCVHANHV